LKRNCILQACERDHARRHEPLPAENDLDGPSATLVDKQALFGEADVVTVHLVLSGRTRGLIAAPEFALMKPTATFVTARSPTRRP
jgi:phosphoglycerate dehydrogenase-like enzyme